MALSTSGSRFSSNYLSGNYSSLKSLFLLIFLSACLSENKSEEDPIRVNDNGNNSSSSTSTSSSSSSSTSSSSSSSSSSSTSSSSSSIISMRPCGSLAHGQSSSSPAYSRPTVQSPDACASFAITKTETCSDGTLTTVPSISYSNCKPDDESEPASLTQHQGVTLDFEGPNSSESSNNPNPFLDYRFNLTIRHRSSGTTHVIPGFFDGDGRGNGSGNVWRIRFNPELAGAWDYTASFRRGANVATSLSPTEGVGEAFDGESGSITIAPLDPNAPGFLKWGRLEYVNGHYLKFKDGPYWIKGGTDDPEDFFGYRGFDGTPSTSHHYTNHVADWRTGDPDWNSGKGKGIIGALNHLSKKKVNSIYFLLMNIGGDGKNTHPFLDTVNLGGSSSNDNKHYDISKLAQWEVVMDHAQRKGIHLHLVLNEAEEANKKELDGATLGVERKLFYRELIARFGHHPAMQWNLSEEYEYKYAISAKTIKDFAEYIRNVDPFDRPITVHNQANPDITWAPFVGNASFDLTSFQYSGGDAGRGSEVEEWRKRTDDAGRPIPIMMDELRALSTSNMESQRKDILWPTLMSGGGIEFYMSGAGASLNDFNPYNNIWDWTWSARKFLEENTPFWEMQPQDNLVSGENTSDGGAQVFAKAGNLYAIYFPNASSTGTLNLSTHPGSYELKWYNPKTGQFEGPTRVVSASANTTLGAPPSASTQDWALLVKKVP